MSTVGVRRGNSPYAPDDARYTGQRRTVITSSSNCGRFRFGCDGEVHHECFVSSLLDSGYGHRRDVDAKLVKFVNQVLEVIVAAARRTERSLKADAKPTAAPFDESGSRHGAPVFVVRLDGVMQYLVDLGHGHSTTNARPVWRSGVGGSTQIGLLARFP